jgi:ribonuclease HI
MTHDGGDIVEMVIVDKREVKLKSPNMEVTAFLKALEELLKKGLKVKEVVTDAHTTIASKMSKSLLWWIYYVTFCCLP